MESEPPATPSIPKLALCACLSFAGGSHIASAKCCCNSLSATPSLPLGIEGGPAGHCGGKLLSVQGDS